MFVDMAEVKRKQDGSSEENRIMVFEEHVAKFRAALRRALETAATGGKASGEAGAKAASDGRGRQGAAAGAAPAGPAAGTATAAQAAQAGRRRPAGRPGTWSKSAPQRAARQSES
jgi:hypothetical protein